MSIFFASLQAVICIQTQASFMWMLSQSPWRFIFKPRWQFALLVNGEKKFQKLTKERKQEGGILLALV